MISVRYRREGPQEGDGVSRYDVKGPFMLKLRSEKMQMITSPIFWEDENSSAQIKNAYEDFAGELKQKYGERVGMPTTPPWLREMNDTWELRINGTPVRGVSSFDIERGCRCMRFDALVWTEDAEVA